MYCTCHPRHHPRRNYYRRNADQEAPDSDSSDIVSFCRFSTLYKDYKLVRSPYFTMPVGLTEVEFYQKLGQSLGARLDQYPNDPIYNVLAHLWEAEYPLLSVPGKESYKLYPEVAIALTETDIDIPPDQLHLPSDIQYEFQLPYKLIEIQYDKEPCFVCAIRIAKVVEPAGMREESIKAVGPHELVQLTTQIKTLADPKSVTHKSILTKLRLKPGRTLEATVAAALGAPMKTFGHGGPQWVPNEDTFKSDLDNNTMIISRLAIGALFIALSKDDNLVQALWGKKNLGATRHYTIGKEFQTLSRRASIRRGHMHWVRHGPGKTQRKLMFYHPMLVKEHEYLFQKFTPPDEFDPTDKRRIRDTTMSRSLKRKYNYTCQVCGIRLSSINGQGYAEGAHIVPFGSPYHGPDEQSNLLVLCPNHHAEFDMGVLAIDPETFRTSHIDTENPYHNVPLKQEHQIESENLRHHLRRFDRES